MRKLHVFNFITLDGYYEGAHKGDISWHQHGGEENDFATDSSSGGSTLLFGRVTYEYMASYWPTELALKNDPALAANMNRAEKIVCSRTLKNADWNNTTVISDNIVEAVKKLKQQPGNDITILGSGSIVTQFADAGLIDGFQFMLDPVAIGAGTSIFKGLKQQLNLELTGSKTFKSGVVLLNYAVK